MTLDAPPTTPVVPIRALAYDEDAAFIVERASTPPITAAQRFRREAAPLAAQIAEQVRVAHDLLAGAAHDLEAHQVTGRRLRDLVVQLRGLAESYDVAPVADVYRAREAGAATLDPRAVAGIEHVAHGLLGEVAQEHDRTAATRTPAEPTPAVLPAAEPQPAVPAAGEPLTDEPRAASEHETEPDDTTATDLLSSPAPIGLPAPIPVPVPEVVAAVLAGSTVEEARTADVAPTSSEASAPAFRPPTGPALVALLADGIRGIEQWPDRSADVPAATEDGIVSITALCYSGRAALTRAREIRDALRAHAGAPDPELLAELFDLIDLAATD